MARSSRKVCKSSLLLGRLRLRTFVVGSAVCVGSSDVFGGLLGVALLAFVSFLGSRASLGRV